MSVSVYIMRHAEAETGEREDPTRELTSTGKGQARMMGRWLKRQTTKPEIVLHSNMKRSRQTAKRVADRLGLDAELIYGGLLDPDADPEQSWEGIIRAANNAEAKCVIAVTHGPLVEELVALATHADPSQIHFAHAAVAFIDSDTDKLHWLVTPNVVARDEDEQDLVTSDAQLNAQEAELVDAADALVELLEANGEYYYEDVTKKRWVLGDGGRSGNCEDCVENADEGWIEESEPFPAGDDPVVEPPLHPNCTCDVEYRDTRQRVYV